MKELELHDALLWRKLPSKSNLLQCQLCSKYCTIEEGKRGFCNVRMNKKGKLYTLNYGRSSGFAIDPIEKKPFFNFKPGSNLLSFGTPGCNMRCLNCQNWDLSQGVVDGGDIALTSIDPTYPKDVAKMCVRLNADGIAYTYSEPTIFFEYARDCVLETRKIEPEKSHVFVSNGYFSKEALELIQKEKLLDAIKIDLKCMREEEYVATTTAHLKPVLDSIERVYKSGIHLEIVHLTIPGHNDSEEEFREMCKWLAKLSKDIPIHFTRFHPDYKMRDVPATPEGTLLKAKKIAEEEGLRYIYIGNTSLRGVENTYCPNCHELLIERYGFDITKNVFSNKKTAICPRCGEKINVIL